MSLALDRFPSQFLKSAGNLSDEPAWMRKAREVALGVFHETGVPTTKNEEWKYTHLREFAETDWQVTSESVPLQSEPQFLTDDSALRVLVVNGTLVSAPKTLPDGLTIQALDPTDPRVEPRFSRAGGQVTQTATRTIEPDTYPFGALNTANFTSGLFVHLAENVAVDQVIEIVNVLQSGPSPTLVLPRTLLVAEAGSKARIVETYLTDGSSKSASVPVTEVFLGQQADIEHVRLQDQCPCSTHIGLWQARQERDSSYTSFNIAYGSKLSRLDQTIWIGGEGCSTRLDGVVCAQGEQHIDNHTRLDHALPNCDSYEIYKQIVGDKASVVFNGKIFVHQDAQKTDAKQTNQALLLRPGATVNSKPQLEIFADDVKCTHGATVGQIEDLPMFYMRSRGVSKEEAQAVLVYAFAAEVLELVSMDPVRRALEKRLYERLGVDLGH